MNNRQPKIKYEKWLKMSKLGHLYYKQKIQSICMHILVPQGMVMDISRENCTPPKIKFIFNFSLNNHYSFMHVQLA
jgi:hypothetical protein